MCPVIDGADLTKVSTSRDPYPEGEYHVTVVKSELSDDRRSLTFQNRIDEPAEYAETKRIFFDNINIRDENGKWNDMGLASIKKYLEAQFGKGSPEAEAFPPNTDPLDGARLGMYLTIREYDSKKEKDANGQPVKVKVNQVKRVWAL